MQNSCQLQPSCYFVVHSSSRSLAVSVLCFIDFSVMYTHLEYKTFTLTLFFSQTLSFHLMYLLSKRDVKGSSVFCIHFFSIFKRIKVFGLRFNLYSLQSAITNAKKTLLQLSELYVFVRK